MSDTEARTQALRLLESSPQQREDALRSAIEHGLDGQLGAKSMRTLAPGLIEIADLALERRGKNEEKYLAPLKKWLCTGKNPAARVLETFPDSRWRDAPESLICYLGARAHD